MTTRETRPCGTHSPHVPHPWWAGLRWCEGWGRYAADRQPAPVASTERCTRSYTGPTGVVWDCVGPAHYTDPNVGIAGSGHTFVARPRTS